MANVSTTKMSSKGQVVIPDIIRKRLNLKPGSQFVVVGDKDIVRASCRNNTDRQSSTT